MAVRQQGLTRALRWLAVSQGSKKKAERDDLEHQHLPLLLSEHKTTSLYLTLSLKINKADIELMADIKDIKYSKNTESGKTHVTILRPKLINYVLILK